MLFRAATLAALMLGAASSLPAQALAYPAAGQLDANAWMIGPILDGRNYSRHMPLHPTSRRNGGFHIDLPQAPGSVNYVTFRHGSLAGKSRIVMRYRLEAAPGVRILARSDGRSDGIITPYFQRSGDNWSARGRYESYRWYGTFATQTIKPGEHLIVAPLNGLWTAVETSSSRTNPRGFRDAVAAADQVGFVLGGGDGYGHGIHATGPARLVVTEFRVE
jgi:hypothetical protein